MRGSNRPSTQDDLVACGALRLDGRQALRQDVGLHGQVEAMPRCAQVSQGRADANAVGVVHREWSHPAGLRVVHIRIMREVGIETGLIEGDLGGLPGVWLVASDG